MCLRYLPFRKVVYILNRKKPLEVLFILTKIKISGLLWKYLWWRLPEEFIWKKYHSQIMHTYFFLQIMQIIKFSRMETQLKMLLWRFNDLIDHWVTSKMVVEQKCGKQIDHTSSRPHSTAYGNGCVKLLTAMTAGRNSSDIKVMECEAISNDCVTDLNCS